MAYDIPFSKERWCEEAIFTKSGAIFTPISLRKSQIHLLSIYTNYTNPILLPLCPADPNLLFSFLGG